MVVKSKCSALIFWKYPMYMHTYMIYVHRYRPGYEYSTKYVLYTSFISYLYINIFVLQTHHAPQRNMYLLQLYSINSMGHHTKKTSTHTQHVTHWKVDVFSKQDISTEVKIFTPWTKNHKLRRMCVCGGVWGFCPMNNGICLRCCFFDVFQMACFEMVKLSIW